MGFVTQVGDETHELRAPSRIHGSDDLVKGVTVADCPPIAHRLSHHILGVGPKAVVHDLVGARCNLLREIVVQICKLVGDGETKLIDLMRRTITEIVTRISFA